MQRLILLHGQVDSCAFIFVINFTRTKWQIAFVETYHWRLPLPDFPKTYAAGSNLLKKLAPLVVIYQDCFTAAGRTSDFANFLRKHTTHSILGSNPFELSVKLDFLERELKISILDTPAACRRSPKAIFVRTKILRCNRKCASFQCCT